MRKSIGLLSLVIACALVIGMMPSPAYAGLDGYSVTRGKFETSQVLDVSNVKFLYLESQSVSKSASQNIVVGLADENAVPVSAELDIVHGNGAVATVKQSATTRGAVSFSIAGGKLKEGTYRVSSFRFAMKGKSGKKYSVSFASDSSSSYSFTVTQANSGSNSNQASLSAYALGTDGKYVKTDSIESALAAAGATAKGKAASGKGVSAQAKSGFTVVLDPGHGGYDGGASGIGFNEKDVNLKIGLYCKKALEKKPGVTVYMTRTDDTYVSLSDRVQFAVDHKADLIVSLHNNAGGGSGSEVIVPRDGSWYRDETYVTGQGLGKEILKKLNALGLGTSAGVYSRDSTNGETYPDGTLSDYYALVDGPRESGLLGIIVEHAFVDDAGDAAFLSSEANLKKLGKADANAIVKYYNSSNAISYLYWGIFDYDYYLSHYANVKKRYNKSKVGALGYFKKKGMGKGHRANVLFDVNYYRSKYPDLNESFGNNLRKYYKHFLKYGMKEGRRGSAEFSPTYYKKHNADLRRAFGSDWTQYYKHYALYGMREGRKGAKASVKLKNATTVYKGVDYSAVYDASYYAKKNKDAKKWAKSGNTINGKKLIKHFVKYGMNEGRKSSKGFSLTSYYNANPDLRKEFGTDWAAYYRHYAKIGKKEGRVATGVKKLKHPLSTYKGKNYSAVYNGVYYAKHNPAVAKRATLKTRSGSVLDEKRLIKNFVKRGMKNGRQAKKSFNVKIYMKNYSDLRNRFGKDLKAYYLHYIDKGEAEGRNARSVIEQPIMGAAKTTVGQMVRRYKSVGKKYPSKIYKKYGAATMKRFCKLVYSEAVAEGVRPEVVFAQAMHETGWLQFGGDVKAKQCNFAGIGATGGGTKGASFNSYGKKSVRMGLRAQVQHLKAYASDEPLNKKVIDPRFAFVDRASATSVEDLSGRWATSKTYGTALVKQIRSLLKA